MTWECFQYYFVNIYCSLAFYGNSRLDSLVPTVPEAFFSLTEAVLCLIEVAF